MAQERLIVRRPLVWYAAAADPATWVAIEGFVKKITIKGKRGKVDTKGYSDGGARNEKLDPEHEVDLSFFHSRTWSEWSALLIDELNADDPTWFRVKYRGAVAAGTANRIFQFKVQLTDIGTIGGEMNTASMADMTLPIEGMVQSSTDGTTFTDYF